MPTIRVNGIELHYKSRGAGEPLLLIAGFACDYTIWSLLVPSLAQKYRVISFDNRGVGQSSSPDGPYSIPQMAEDAAALLDALGVSSAHVAGHSMGGKIALELALAQPAKVRSLILVTTSAGNDARSKSIIETFGDLPNLIDARTSARLIMPWIYTSQYFAKPGAIDQLMKALTEYPYPPTPQGMFHQSRAISAFDATSRLGDIRCPTLVIGASEDVLTPAKFSAELAAGIPGAELVVLEKTGHGLLIETPDAVTNIMLEFLAKHAADSRHDAGENK